MPFLQVADHRDKNVLNTLNSIIGTGPDSHLRTVGACQKDLKQVWADKEFHETTIAHIESVFALVNKACKCTNNSKMILTAMQSISQLIMLQGKDWDFDGFTDVVLSTPTFAEGGKVIVDTIGAIDCSLTPSSDIKVSYQSEHIHLNTSYT